MNINRLNMCGEIVRESNGFTSNELGSICSTLFGKTPNCQIKKKKKKV